MFLLRFDNKICNSYLQKLKRSFFQKYDKSFFFQKYGTSCFF